jgi:hypothetical protein
VLRAFCVYPTTLYTSYCLITSVFYYIWYLLLLLVLQSTAASFITVFTYFVFFKPLVSFLSQYMIRRSRHSPELRRITDAGERLVSINTSNISCLSQTVLYSTGPLILCRYQSTQSLDCSFRQLTVSAIRLCLQYSPIHLLRIRAGKCILLFRVITDMGGVE